ncbi:hypothetical protein ES703_116091 [subsurface metagenome]
MSTWFDSLMLADKLVELFQTLLNREFGSKIRQDIDGFKRNAEEIKNSPNSVKALKVLVELIATRSFRYPKPTFEGEFKEWETKNGGSWPLSNRAKEELIKLVERLTSAAEWPACEVRELLNQLEGRTISEWIGDFYEEAKKGKSLILGEKGRDNFLRDFGYFDRIPIDIHEMRFILRTGIFHAFSMDGLDPLRKKHLQEALANFCKEYLTGKNIEGIDLGKSPGIVDLFIWYYCARGKYNVCGAKPKCGKCMLNGYCLFSILH